MIDFIKKKIVLRSVVSCIAPIMLYTGGYIVLMVIYLTTSLVKEVPLYTNMYAWLTILAFAVVYPLNQISLWLLFAPIEHIIDRKIKTDPKKNPILKGNFAPIT